VAPAQGAPANTPTAPAPAAPNRGSNPPATPPAAQPTVPARATSTPEELRAERDKRLAELNDDVLALLPALREKAAQAGKDATAARAALAELQATQRTARAKKDAANAALAAASARLVAADGVEFSSATDFLAAIGATTESQRKATAARKALDDAAKGCEKNAAAADKALDEYMDILTDVECAKENVGRAPLDSAVAAKLSRLDQARVARDLSLTTAAEAAAALSQSQYELSVAIDGVIKAGAKNADTPATKAFESVFAEMAAATKKLAAEDAAESAARVTATEAAATAADQAEPYAVATKNVMVASRVHAGCKAQVDRAREVATAADQARSLGRGEGGDWAGVAVLEQTRARWAQQLEDNRKIKTSISSAKSKLDAAAKDAASKCAAAASKAAVARAALTPLFARIDALLPAFRKSMDDAKGANSAARTVAKDEVDAAQAAFLAAVKEADEATAKVVSASVIESQSTLAEETAKSTLKLCLGLPERLAVFGRGEGVPSELDKLATEANTNGWLEIAAKLRLEAAIMRKKK
jgi:hypothetical protein